MLTMKRYTYTPWIMSARVFQREKMVLSLVVAGAGFIVLVAVVSAALIVRRVLYRNRYLIALGLLYVFVFGNIYIW